MILKPGSHVRERSRGRGIVLSFLQILPGPKSRRSSEAETRWDIDHREESGEERSKQSGERARHLDRQWRIGIGEVHRGPAVESMDLSNSNDQQHGAEIEQVLEVLIQDR